MQSRYPSIRSINSNTCAEENAALLQGTMKTLYAPIGLERLPERLILRALDWYDSLASIDKDIQERSAVVFEFLLGVRKPHADRRRSS